MLVGTNRLRTRRGMTAEVQGRRMSGDMCTSLGNGFTNLMVFLFICEEYKMSGLGFVEGDDGIFAVQGELRAEMFAALGFTVDIKEIQSPGDGHFCGMQFSSDYTLVKDARDVMRKFGWTHSNIHAGDKVMKELLRAKALSLAYELPDCPIVWAIAKRALADTAGSEPRFVYDGYHMPPPAQINLDFGHPSDCARRYYESRYGVSVAEQLRIEEAILAGSHDMLLSPPPDVQLYAAAYLESV